MSVWTQESVDRLTSAIPHAPGIYLMRDREGKIVYIGKAIDLANRVSSYFRSSSDTRPFVGLLSSVLDRIDTVVTTNEKEALLLESELIKRHKPPFNIMLRDDKHFLYLRIDPRLDFPRLELMRRRKPDGALYFGPYHNASSIRSTHALVNRHFGLRTCSDSEMRNRSRPCLEHQMHRCMGPCVGLGVKGAYERRVEAAILFLRGRHDEVRRSLQSQMEDAAEAENFEEAARIRDQLRAIQAAMTRQAVVLPAMRDADSVGFAREGDCAAFAVLRFEAGVLVERIPYCLDGVVAPEEDLVETFLVQFYGRAPIPEAVLLPPGVPESVDALEQVLKAKGKPGFKVRQPVRGPEADAVRMAVQNARLLLEESLAGAKARDRALDRVAEMLGLARPPRRIEGFDMSVTQSVEPVGSMVVFTDGRPDRNAYRNFAVRGEEGPGDVGFMREVLKRRFTRSLADGGLPDLVLLDGGEAQLGVVADLMAEIGLSSVPLVGIAKSRVIGKGHGPAVHSPERLYVLPPARGVREDPIDAELIVPPPSDPGLNLLVRVRDEAHRFAVKFHRKRRAKRETASVLDGIPGLGKRRRVELLRHFGSVTDLKAATAEQVAAVKGLPEKVATAVIERLSGTGKSG